MDDLAMTYSDFVNALKMLICSEKHPVSRANYMAILNKMHARRCA